MNRVVWRLRSAVRHAWRDWKLTRRLTALDRELDRPATKWRTTYETPDYLLVADSLLTLTELDALGAEWVRRANAGTAPGVNEHVWTTVNGRLVSAWVRKP